MDRFEGGTSVFDQFREVILKLDECQKDRGDSCRTSCLVQHETTCSRIWSHGRCQEEPEEPRNSLFLRVLAKLANDPVEQRKALAQFANQLLMFIEGAHVLTLARSGLLRLSHPC